jgi:hypothetical protein
LRSFEIYSFRIGFRFRNPVESHPMCPSYRKIFTTIGAFTCALFNLRLLLVVTELEPNLKLEGAAALPHAPNLLQCFACETAQVISRKLICLYLEEPHNHQGCDHWSLIDPILFVLDSCLSIVPQTWSRADSEHPKLLLDAPYPSKCSKHPLPPSSSVYLLNTSSRSTSLGSTLMGGHPHWPYHYLSRAM